MRATINSYITSINNSILAKGSSHVFSLREAINDFYPILKEPFDSKKLFREEHIDIDRTSIDVSIAKTQKYLLKDQKKEGYWISELEANTTLTSEYIMFMKYLGINDPKKEKFMVNHLLSTQQIDGGWNIYYGAQSDLSTTVEAYFAMKLAGIQKDEPYMVRARNFIIKKGGVTKSRIFTKIFLALFNLYDWRGIPSMPAELILLPNSAYINVYELSSWSRSVIIPLLIIFAKKPTHYLRSFEGIDELYAEDKEKIDFSMEAAKFELSWKNLFLATDSILKIVGKSPIKPFRNFAIRKAEKWILDHQDNSGDWGGIIPAMMNSIMALNCLGYKLDHPVIKKGLDAIDRFCIKEKDEIRLQSCISPVWDTAYAVHALRLSGVPEDHPAMVKSAEWLIDKQITKRKGDWQVKKPDAKPGGWAFEFDNEFYPDTDDTAEVLIALDMMKIPEDEKRVKSVKRGINWLFSMQSSNGGWGAFDIDNDKEILNRVPFSDLEALLDPPTADVTARILWFMGQFGYDKSHKGVKAAYNFLRMTQEKDGTWFGRWGVNYIYGTFLSLRGLSAIGENMEQPYIKKAIDWLMAHQNHDGGWGETCKSYEDISLKGVGVSTASQTAWALIGLMAAGETNSYTVKRGIKYLTDRQNEDGTWDESEFTGTGFPKYFFIKYHMYRIYFPLLALAEYKKNMAN